MYELNEAQLETVDGAIAPLVLVAIEGAVAGAVGGAIKWAYDKLK